MNTKIIFVAVLVSLLGYGVYYLSTNQTNESQPIDNSGEPTPVETDEQNPAEVEENAEMSTSGTFADLRQREGDFRCEFMTQTLDAGVNQLQEGVLYSSGNRMRMDGYIKSDTQLTPDGSTTMDISMIMIDEVMYSWSDQGAIVMDLSELEDDEAQNPALPEGNPMDLYDQTVQYECADWSVEESVFILPEGVEFIDINQMMETMMNGLEVPEELILQ